MLDIKNCAVVVIDIQEKLVKATGFGDIVVQNFSKITKAASILGIPTILTEQYPKGLGYTVKQVKNSLGRNAKIIEKTTFSAMEDEHFYTTLKNLGVKQIVLGGIETHICVLQTAISLIQTGFEVFILKDCCASRNNDDFTTGIDLLKQYGAKITCVEIVLFEWLKTSKNPHFKEIQELIK